MVHTMFPAWPTFGFGTCAFPVTESAAEIVTLGGGGGAVTKKALALTGFRPVSIPLNVPVTVMPLAWICAMALTLTVARAGSVPPKVQVICVTPIPPPEQVPIVGWARIRNAP